MATYYWYNGSGSWDGSSTANWSTSATNPRSSFPAASAPTFTDDVVFDSLSGTGTVTIYVSAVCNNLTASTSPAGLIFSNIGTNFEIWGSVNFGANATSDAYLLGLRLYGTGTGKTVTIANASLVGLIDYVDTGSWSQSASTVGANITVYGGATVTFTGAITMGGLNVGGTLTTGAFTHTINGSFGVSVNAGTVNLSNTTLNLTNSVSTSFAVISGGTLTTTNSTINCGVVGTTGSADFEGGGLTYNVVNMAASTMRLLGLASNTFATFTATGTSSTLTSLTFTNSQTITNVLTIQGKSINERLFVYPAQVGGISETPPTITLTLSGAGAKIFKWADFQDITLSVTGATPTFTSVGDCLGNTGFTFTPAVTRYAVLRFVNVAITGTAGQFSFNSTAVPLVAGISVTVSGVAGQTYPSAGGISGYTNPTTYYIIGTPTATTFQLSATFGGSPITTAIGTPTGLTFRLSYYDNTNPGTWSTTSGGVTGATAPLPQDTIVFDEFSSNAILYLYNLRICKDVIFSASNLQIVASAGGNPENRQFFIYGTAGSEFFSAFQAASFAKIVFESRSSILLPTINTSWNIKFNGYGGIYTATGPITTTSLDGEIIPVHGSFYSAGYSVTAVTINMTAGTSSASWYAATSNITVTNNFNFYTVGTTSFASSTITLLAGSGTSFLGAYSPATFGTVIISSNSASQVLLIIDNPPLTISKLVNSGTAPKYFSLSNSGTTTIGTLEINGSASSPVLFGPFPLSVTTPATINLTNSVTTSFVAFRNVTKTGAGTLTATGVANLGKNTGITFSSTLYGIAYTGSVGSSVTGSFTVPSNFSGSSMLVAIGGGGGGAKRIGVTGSAGGGGAGALAVASNLPLSAGQTIYFSAGAGGLGGTSASGQSGGGGGASWINISTNAQPSSTGAGVAALGGGGSGGSGTAGGSSGSQTSSIAVTLKFGGGAGGNGASGTTVGAGGGGSAPSLNNAQQTLAYSGASAGVGLGGAGGGGTAGSGGSTNNSTGGLGGLNSSSAQASGGTINNPGTAGTLGGGGGGGGGNTTASGVAGKGGDASTVVADYVYTSLNGVVASGVIGPTGGGGGGGTSSGTGTGGAGGSSLYGGGGGGGGRGSTTAINGNGGDGGVGVILFVYTIAPQSKSQGSIIG